MTGDPDRYGVIGWPLAHTRSPQIHAMFAAQTRQHLRYDAIPVAPADLAGVLDDFIAGGGRGLNVTVPHKVAVFERFRDGGIERDPDRLLRMTLAGAANTLIIDEGSRQVTLDNTDGAGLVRDLTANLGLELGGRHLLVLGAGGAARGVASPLLDAGCETLTIVNRTAAKAEFLVDTVRRLRTRFGLPARLRGGGFELLTPTRGETRYDLIINATSAGLAGETPPLPDHVAAGAFCYDMLYGADTPFAAWARAHDAAGVALGLGMLVEQAAESFALWRGVRPATAPVLAALRG